MHELALFAGGGGGLLATRLLGFRCIGYVESDPDAQAVIAARVRDGILDDAPCWSDVRTFLSDGHAERYRGVVDVVTAGWPCPPVSCAGKRAGKDDERWLWPAVVEVLRATRPLWFLGENVAGLLSANAGRELGDVLRDLAALGFDAEWCVLGAADLGAPHRRDRFWIAAVDREQLRARALPDAIGDALRAESERGRGTARAAERGDAEPRLVGANVADAERGGCWPGREPGGLGGVDAGRANDAGAPPQPDAGVGLAAREFGRLDAGRQGDGRRAAVDRGAGEVVGDAALPGLARTDAGGERGGCGAALGDGEGLADTDPAGRREQRRALADGEECSAVERGGHALADPDSGHGDGVHERIEPGHLEADARGSGAGEEGDASLWPPGPDDADGWLRWLELHPGTEPAVPRPESALRGGSPGVAGRVDISRAARLRILGNGMVPIVAATAWRELMSRLKASSATAPAGRERDSGAPIPGTPETAKESPAGASREAGKDGKG